MTELFTAKTLTLATAALALSTSALLAGGPPAREGETKRSYEMTMFDEATETQGPGFQLAVPGDMVRYTYVITDEFINDPAYTLQRAVLGIHIIDKDLEADASDEAKEWGRITLDGQTLETRDGELTDHVEIRADVENERQLPPYIYNIPQLIADDGMITIEVTNLDSAGGTSLEAEYGDFNVMRAGLHLYYVKSE